MRICVIFNPSARGNKARRFRRWLDGVAAECELRPTAGPNDARRIAAAAVREKFDLIVAAGGDGTVNEVLNGLGDVPDGFARARFGVLPLGTVNVFARELNLPLRHEAAWKILKGGRELGIDLPVVEFAAQGKVERRYFAQLAGAGLDARAIELVSWRLKKKVGPLAYGFAGFQALAERQPKIIVRADGRDISGELVLIGNGKFYGGAVPVFPAADLQNGRLEACVFPRVNLWRLLRCAPGLLVTRKLPEQLVRRISAARLELSSDEPVAFELDGEWVGNLPAAFFIGPKKLRVVVP